MHGVSNRDVRFSLPHNNSSVHPTTTTEVQRSGRITDGMQSGCRTPRDSTFIPDIGTHPPGMALPRTTWVRINRLRTVVRRFYSCLYKLGMTPSAACECGEEEQIVDHVVLQCPIHRPPYGTHVLTVLDVETIEWLLNTCPEI